MFKVYDKKGEMFEVTANKARDLIDSGWTPWPKEEEITQYDLFRDLDARTSHKQHDPT